MPKFQIHASLEVPITFTHHARISVEAANEAEAMAKLNAMTPDQLKTAIKRGLGTVDSADSIEFDAEQVIQAVEAGDVSGAFAIEVED